MKLNKKVSILLATYNGENYLKKQLDSLFSQTYQDFQIIARDDGSSDKTIEILQAYDITLLNSKKNLGVKQSFNTLLEYAVDNTDSEYFMFCDQDDIWNNTKVEKSINQIINMEKEYDNIPLLIHTDLEVISEDEKILNSSFWNYQNLNPSINSFHRLLMQNTVTGCTMIINKNLAKKSLPIPSDAIMHDWWLALYASYFGKIQYLNEATIKYRQHSSNKVGAQNFYTGYMLNKLKSSSNSILEKHIKQASIFAQTFDESIDKDTKTMLQEFTKIEKKNYLQRISLIFKHHLFKQGIIRNIGLLIKI